MTEEQKNNTENQNKKGTKDSIYKKWWFWVIAVFAFFIIIGAISEEPEIDPAGQEEEKKDVEEAKEEEKIEEAEEKVVIDYSILREWNPDSDSNALGLEILITEEDASEENIIDLIRDITGTKEKVIIKVYQSKEAWDEEKSGEYTEEYNRGYLVFYVKNTTDSGAYRGFNEIRWFQEEGDLSHLFGEKTKF